MLSVLVLFKKEMRSYFVSPLGYILACIFLILSGLFFNGQSSIAGNFLILILFICPIITIKLFSEEKRSGTIELLLTSPITSLELVIGKFLSAFALYIIILVPTISFVLLTAYYSPVNPDMGLVISSYLGLILMGGSLIAIGVFASAVSQSQVIAGLIGFGVSIFFLLIYGASNLLAEVFGLSNPLLRDIVEEISLLSHYFDFDKGIINTSNVIYYFLWMILFLMLANK
ncbi:MAG: ABC transporter permease, partial [Spirochaetota bacterium]|nr:ABC transporter permease [Spirochaetota bacterium]